MNTFVLEIIAPFVVGSLNNNANRLAPELVALAEKHGGIVVESPGSSNKTSFQRRCVNMVDNEISLEKEVEGLRKKFPDTRFTLEEFSLS